MGKLRTLNNQGQAIQVEPLEDSHAFHKAYARHKEAEQILAALIQIEAYRLDALKRMKAAEPGSDEHSDYASALAVLLEKRKEAQRNYAGYFKNCLELLRWNTAQP